MPPLSSHPEAALADPPPPLAAVARGAGGDEGEDKRRATASRPRASRRSKRDRRAAAEERAKTPAAIVAEPSGDDVIPVGRIAVRYLLLPLLSLCLSTSLHGSLPRGSGLRASGLLLLGFDSPDELWGRAFESFLGAACWSVAFLFVRKGCNAGAVAASRAGEEGGDARRGRPSWYTGYVSRVKKSWRGAFLSLVSITLGSVGKAMIKRRETPRDEFCRLCGLLASSTDGARLCDDVYEALLVGLGWAASQFLIRRRLDPRQRCDDMFRRHRQDVFFGASALTVTALLRSGRGEDAMSLLVLEEMLENFGGRTHGSRSCSGEVTLLLLAASEILEKKASPSRTTFGGSTPRIRSVRKALANGLTWGVPYLFVRCGMNPAMRDGYLSNHWRDAFWGGVALCCTPFLKAGARDGTTRLWRWLASPDSATGRYDEHGGEL